MFTLDIQSYQKISKTTDHATQDLIMLAGESEQAQIRRSQLIMFLMMGDYIRLSDLLEKYIAEDILLDWNNQPYEIRFAQTFKIGSLVQRLDWIATYIMHDENCVDQLKALGICVGLLFGLNLQLAKYNPEQVTFAGNCQHPTYQTGWLFGYNTVSTFDFSILHRH